MAAPAAPPITVDNVTFDLICPMTFNFDQSLTAKSKVEDPPYCNELRHDFQNWSTTGMIDGRVISCGEFLATATVRATGPETEVNRWHCSFIQNITQLERIANYTKDVQIVESFQTITPLPIRDEGADFIAFPTDTMQSGVAKTVTSSDPPPSRWPVSLTGTRWPAVADTNAAFVNTTGSAQFKTWLILARDPTPGIPAPEGPNRAAVVLLGWIEWRADYTTGPIPEPPASPPLPRALTVVGAPVLINPLPVPIYTTHDLMALGDGNYPDLRIEPRTASMFQRATKSGDTLGLWSMDGEDQLPMDKLYPWEPPEHDLSFLP